MDNIYEKILSEMPMTLDEFRLWMMLLLQSDVRDNTFLNLFHYTDFDAKYKIIQSDSIDFRFSLVSNFLDKNEGVHILEPFYHALGILYNQEEISKEFYQALKRIGICDVCRNAENKWIICFSENGNSQYMKERYAPRDGCVIGIGANYLTQMCSNIHNSEYSLEIYKVEYSQKRITDKIIQLLRFIHSSYDYEITTMTASKDELISKLKQIVISFLVHYSYIYKSSEYQNEQEVRMIFTATDKFLEWASEENKERLYYKESDDTNSLHLSLCREALYYCETDVELCNDYRVNKSVITSEEIKAVYRE